MGTGNYTEIIYETPEEHIARITLNRPKQRNAYSTNMCEELVHALDAYLKDDDQRVLLLTGAGKGFCAGGDISGADASHAELMTRQLSHGREMRDGMHRVIRALHDIDKPVVALVNGAAVAGGLTLAMACDLRIASDQARLGDTSGRFALLPDEGGGWFFPRFMGLDKAMKMTLLSETYSAAEAMELGLLTEVVPHDELEARGLEIGRRFANQAPVAVRLAKAMMKRAMTQTLDHALGDAALSVMIANPGEDVREGVSAFFQKREPKFVGR